ncbi:hypothetical protein HK096_006361, partial [Nowakowskiella sp. JEL0078]
MEINAFPSSSRFSCEYGIQTVISFEKNCKAFDYKKSPNVFIGDTDFPINFQENDLLNMCGDIGICIDQWKEKAHENESPYNLALNMCYSDQQNQINNEIISFLLKNKAITEFVCQTDSLGSCYYPIQYLLTSLPNLSDQTFDLTPVMKGMCRPCVQEILTKLIGKYFYAISNSLSQVQQEKFSSLLDQIKEQCQSDFVFVKQERRQIADNSTGVERLLASDSVENSNLIQTSQFDIATSIQYIYEYEWVTYTVIETIMNTEGSVPTQSPTKVIKESLVSKLVISPTPDKTIHEIEQSGTITTSENTSATASTSQVESIQDLITQSPSPSLSPTPSYSPSSPLISPSAEIIVNNSNIPEATKTTEANVTITSATTPSVEASIHEIEDSETISSHSTNSVENLNQTISPVITIVTNFTTLLITEASDIETQTPFKSEEASISEIAVTETVDVLPSGNISAISPTPTPVSTTTASVKAAGNDITLLASPSINPEITNIESQISTTTGTSEPHLNQGESCEFSDQCNTGCCSNEYTIDGTLVCSPSGNSCVHRSGTTSIQETISPNPPQTTNPTFSTELRSTKSTVNQNETTIVASSTIYSVTFTKNTTETPKKTPQLFYNGHLCGSSNECKSGCCTDATSFDSRLRCSSQTQYCIG